MYLEHYGLREPPFSITPDPRFVFLSERHRDALAHLLYGIGQGGGSGFVQLTGEVGTGKTTISRLLLEQLPETTRVALILNPLLSPVELLEAIGEELHLDIEGRRGNVKALVDALNVHLLRAHAEGLRVVLIIDEAQNLSAAALEQVRLLTNLETATQKLLQIILLGQPELREQLARPELRQLAQRITARYHLAPLDPGESESYLRHRWAVAGGGTFAFTSSTARRLHRHAGGVPRLLNVIAERALLAGYARGERVVGQRLLDLAANEVLAPRAASRRWLLPAAIAATAVTTWVVAATLKSHAGWPQPVVATPAPMHVAAARNPTPRGRTPAHPAAEAPIVSPTPARSAQASIDDVAFAAAMAAASPDARPAWSRLLSMWSIRPDEIGETKTTTCPSFRTPGLFCTIGKQRLSLLAQFDRPVLLKLRAGNHPAWVVLLGLDSTRAVVQLDDRAWTVHRSALEDALEAYAIVGRAPGELALPIRRGDTGAGVQWLRWRLLESQPASAMDPSGSLDDPVVGAVRRAQRDFGLHPDGVVGPETLLALMAVDRDGPHLRKLPE